MHTATNTFILHIPIDLEYHPKARISEIICAVWFLHPTKIKYSIFDIFNQIF